MCIIDDPMLALIARFVVEDIDNISISDEHYLKHQVAEIRSCIENAPKKQQQQLALAWIKEHAEHYRQEWKKKTFSKIVLDKIGHAATNTEATDELINDAIEFIRTEA